MSFSEVIEYLREFNIASTALRLCLAALFGGLIGSERERKHRPAGFRTYMIVCVGAALTMLTSQYLISMLDTAWLLATDSAGIKTDVSRIGAQVINGIGFLGAGTVLVTGHQQVKGLTTAAGLWACACTGLAVGAGFYECMLFAMLLMILSIRVLPALENAVRSGSRYLDIYVEFRAISDISEIIRELKGREVRIFDVDVNRAFGEGRTRSGAVFSLYLPRKSSHTSVLAALSKIPSVLLVEKV